MDCDTAKSFFAERGIKYAEKDIGTSTRAQRELIRLVGVPAVPTLVIGGEVIWGFGGNRERIEALVADLDKPSQIQEDG